MIGAYPVHRATPKIFFATSCLAAPRGAALWARLRPSLRLIARLRRVESVSFLRRQHIVTTAVHRFEESIGGRPYLIEVASVAEDRWRACIVRIPGVPNALMPFYGRTPDEAARHLSEWLARAYRRAAGPPPPV